MLQIFYYKRALSSRKFYQKFLGYNFCTLIILSENEECVIYQGRLPIILHKGQSPYRNHQKINLFFRKMQEGTVARCKVAAPLLRLFAPRSGLPPALIARSCGATKAEAEVVVAGTRREPGTVGGATAPRAVAPAAPTQDTEIARCRSQRIC